MTLDQRENLGRPLRADAERNRRRILAAAAEVFARRGLDAGLDEIARHAGVGTGTVYRRFPDKAMLIDALFESRLDDLIELAGSAATAPDPWTGLVHLLEQMVERQQADRGLKELLFGDGFAGISPRFAIKIDGLMSLVAEVVDRAQAAGQLRPDVTVTDLAVIQFMLNSVGTFSTTVQPELWRRQLGLLLAGLRADSANQPLPSVPLSLGQLQTICAPTAVGGGRSRP